MLNKYRGFFSSKNLRRSKTRIPVNSLAYSSLESRELLASLVWNYAPNLPAPTADTVSVLANDQSVYVLGGANTNVSYLAPGAFNWSAGPNIDKQRIAPGGGALNNGDIFLFGGVSGGEAIEESYLYDPTNADPQDGDSMSTTRANAAFVTVPATDPAFNRIYAFGGTNAAGTVLNSAEVYDGGTGSWQTIAPMPQGLADFAAVADGTGNIYTFGGRRQAYGISNYVFRYNIASNSWSSLAPNSTQALSALPFKMQDMVAVAGPNTGLAYVIGGIEEVNGSQTLTSSVYAYQFSTNTWTAETNLPTAVSDASATLDADGRLMVVGGRNALGQTVSTVFVTQDLDATDLAPTIVSTPTLNATSTKLYSYQVFATGNPQPTFEFVVKPSGMSVDVHGLVTWTPNETHVGNQSVTIRALNRAGSIEQNFTLAVASSVPLITSTPVTIGGTEIGYSYDVDATGFPDPVYSFVTRPTGMTINAQSGVISWVPTVSQFGSFSVIVKATNSHGNNQQSYSILVADKTAPTAPTNVVVSQTTLSTISLSWTPSTDNVGIAKYQVYEQYKYGWRGSRTGYRLIQDNIPSNQTTVSGLIQGKSYKYIVRGVDVAGNLSTNSNLVSGTTLKLPSVYGPSNLVGVATHSIIKIRYSSYGNPVPTLSLQSAPEGFFFNRFTGLASWTPTDAQVGTHQVVVRATNSEGFSEFTTSIEVRKNLPTISQTFSYFGKSFYTPFAVEGDTFGLQLADNYSNSVITWSIVPGSGPTGMTIDSSTGSVSWLPGAEHVGTATVTFRATNYAGSTDLPLSFTVHPIGTDLRDPTAASDVTVSVIDSNRAAITWTPATDNDAVVSYEIVAYYTWRSRGLHYVYNRFTVPADTTMFEMTNLNTRANKVYIRAYDAAGNTATSVIVNFTLAANPLFPSVGLASPLPTSALAGQNHQIQLNDANGEPRTYSIVNGPTGSTINPGTGLIDWTSSQTTLGTNRFTVRAINQFGYRDYTFSFWVFFTGPPQAVTYTRTGSNSATATWAPPLDSSNVAGYRLYQTWSIGTRSYSRTYDVSATDTSYNVFVVGGPVWHKMSIAAIDTFGNVSVRSSIADFV